MDDNVDDFIIDEEKGTRTYPNYFQLNRGSGCIIYIFFIQKKFFFPSTPNTPFGGNWIERKREKKNRRRKRIRERIIWKKRKKNEITFLFPSKMLTELLRGERQDSERWAIEERPSQYRGPRPFYLLPSLSLSLSVFFSILSWINAFLKIIIFKPPLWNSRGKTLKSVRLPDDLLLISGKRKLKKRKERERERGRERKGERKEENGRKDE